MRPDPDTPGRSSRPGHMASIATGEYDVGSNSFSPALARLRLRDPLPARHVRAVFLLRIRIPSWGRDKNKCEIWSQDDSCPMASSTSQIQTDRATVDADPPWTPSRRTPAETKTSSTRPDTERLRRPTMFNPARAKRTGFVSTLEVLAGLGGRSPESLKIVYR